MSRDGFDSIVRLYSFIVVGQVKIQNIYFRIGFTNLYSFIFLTTLSFNENSPELSHRTLKNTYSSPNVTIFVICIFRFTTDHRKINNN